MAKSDVQITISAVDKATNEIKKVQTSLDQVTNSLSAMASNITTLGAGGALVATMKSLTSAAEDYGKEINKISLYTGASAEQASSLAAIFSRGGAAADEAVPMIAKFGKNVAAAMDDMKEKGDKSNDILTRMGFTFEQLNGKNLVEVFQMVSQKFNDLGSAAQKDQVAMTLFGRSGADMITTLGLTADQMDKAVQKAKELGLILDDQSKKTFQEYTVQGRELKESILAIEVAMGTSLMPTVKALNENIIDSIKWYSQLNQGTKDTITETIELGAKMTIAAGAVTGLWGAVKLMNAAFLATPLGKITAITVALIEAADAWNKYQKANPGNVNLSPDLPVPSSSMPLPIANNPYGDQYVPGLDKNSAVLAAADDDEAAAIRKAMAASNGTSLADKVSGNGSKSRKSELDKYLEELRNQEKVYQDQMKLGEVQQPQYDQFMKDALAGLDNVSAGEGEYWKKLQAEYDIKIKIHDADQKRLEAASEARKMMDEMTRQSQEYDIQNAKSVADEQIKQQTRMIEITEDDLTKRRDIYQKMMDDLTSQWNGMGGDVFGAESQAISVKVKALAELIKQTNNDITNQAKESAKKTKEAWSDTMTDLIMGFRSSADVIKQIESELINNLIRQMGGLSPKTGGLSDIITGLFGGGGSSSGSTIDGIGGMAIGQFASGGVASGWSLVGEQGPELAYFGNKANIYTAGQTRAMLTPASSAPNVNVTVINKSGQQVQVSQQASYNPQAHTMVMQMVVDGIQNNMAGARDLLFGRG